MFELLISVLFVWLFIRAVGMALHVTWGLAKVVAVALFSLALPVLIGCLLMAGGMVLLIPVALVICAINILKVCV